MLQRFVRRVLQQCGFDISRYRPDTHHVARYRKLLRDMEISDILDVGANSGQFGAMLRRDAGFQGNIVSFEPLSTAHALLSRAAEADALKRWTVAPRCALGAASDVTAIHVSRNSVSSSLLPMQDLHQRAAPTSVTEGVERVSVRTLDDVLSEMQLSVHSRSLIKIDTQGYELEVLKGALRSVGKCGVIQLEMSFQPLYRGQPLFGEVYSYVRSRGFNVFDIVPGFADRESGRLLQVDGIFVRDV